MTRFVAVLLAVTALSVTLALAVGGEKGDWEPGAYAGRARPDSYDGLDPDGATLYGARLGYFFTDRWSVEGSYQSYEAGSSAGATDTKVQFDSLRANGLMNFRAGKKFRWFLTAGFGNESAKDSDLDIDTSKFGWNAGGGGRWYFGKKKMFALRADARWVFVDPGGDISGSQTNFETTGGILWSFGGGAPKDSDGDRVPDNKDKCAGTLKGASVDATGCPKDSDADGVFDGMDKCANTPKGWKVDTTGCPADSDADGVADAVDKCAGTPKGAKVDAEGCPTEDADGDGSWDGVDRCPDTPKGAKVDQVGCPMDGDHDGVWDGLDQCPGTPAGTKVDEKGCPAGA